MDQTALEMTAETDFWRSSLGLENITPRGKAWPEGEDFGAFLSELIGQDSVLEFGCGPGRLSGCFDAGRYVGVDISSFAIERARINAPDHRFEIIDDVSPLSSANVTFSHSVLMHVPDDALRSTVERFKSRRVIVSEILGKHWRRSGLPPVFNRDVGDYEEALSPDYRLTSRIDRPCPHYPGTNLSLLEFIRR